MWKRYVNVLYHKLEHVIVTSEFASCNYFKVVFFASFAFYRLFVVTVGVFLLTLCIHVK